MTIEWNTDLSPAGGTIERGFTVTREGDAIPGILWQSGDATSPAPLVLLGHGGSGHKRNERMLMLGRMFAEVYGWNAAAIDGPVHGDRGPVADPAKDPEYAAMWRRDDPVGDMIDDWKAVLDALMARDEVDPERVGYWGVSMGTMFGLPFVASDPRIRVAVLGKAGMTGTSVTRSNIAPHFERYAPQLSQPVLFTMQWDDERFDRAGQLDLYDRLGSRDKRLHAYPGVHVDNGPEAFEVQGAFLQRYLLRP